MIRKSRQGKTGGVMSVFLTALLLLCLVIALSGCSGAPESTASADTAVTGTLPEMGASTVLTDDSESENKEKSTAGSTEEMTASTGETAPAAAENTASSKIPAGSGVPCWINGKHVNFRKAPGAEGEILARLDRGTEIEKLREEGEWLLVRYGEEVGYIHKDYVSDTLPETEAEKVRIIVKKSERKLELWEDGALTGTYSIGLGFSPVGHKSAEGDGRTPEGEYYVCMKNGKSDYYLSLGVSYPNKEDAAAALREGRISQAAYDRIASANDWGERPDWYTPLGGEIMIHGGGGSRGDWTAGCIAVDNEVMDILFYRCEVGTRITILP